MEKIQYGQYEVPSADTMINFGVGQPSNKLLPLKIVQNAMMETMNITNPALLQYGDIPGYYQFRKSLADYLSVKYQIDDINPKTLFISNGVTGALSLICSLFAQTGTTIIVEEPTYFLAINIFKDFKLNIRTVPIHNDGIDLDKVENILSEDPKKKIILYTIPTYHNPTSYTMSEDKRSRLSDLAEKYDNFLIIADEVYQLLYFQDKPPQPLCFYSDKVLSLGSFSKILAPSLRLGWIQTSKKLMAKIVSCGQLDSSGGVNPFVSSIVHQIIDNGSQEKYVNFVRNELSRRCDIICNAIDKHLINYVEYNRPKGGYFVWLKLKKGLNSDDFLQYCIKNKVKFHNGIKFSGNDGCKDCFRLSFSYYDCEDLETGIIRLSESFKLFSRIKINMIGYKGRLGSKIVEVIKKGDDAIFLNGIDRDIQLNLEYDKNVMIDVSSPEGTKALFNHLITNNINIPVIVGTTGELPMTLIKRYSKHNPVAIISNFSNGIPNVINYVRNTNSQDWDIKITETHHVNKKDAPSGTAKTLAKNFDKEVHIESIREKEVFGIHSIMMENKYESIEITHTAKNRELFAWGAVEYAKWIINMSSGIYYSKSKKKISFHKYTGCGNDFIIIDNREDIINDKVEFVKKYSNRRTSVGSDGVIFIENNNELDFTWEYYNSDGTHVEMCGNGARCVSKFAHDYLGFKNPIKFCNRYDNVTSGIVNNDKVRILLPKCKGIDISDDFIKDIHNLLIHNRYDISPDIYTIKVGVPHLVIVTDVVDIRKINMNRIGTLITELFKTNQIDCMNINLCNMCSGTDTQVDDWIINRTYERGVYEETLACGTGCVSVACVAKKYYNFDTNKISVKTESKNTLDVYFNEDDIFLEGDTQHVFSGNIIL